mgnify:CR=1 FL=1
MPLRHTQEAIQDWIQDEKNSEELLKRLGPNNEIRVDDLPPVLMKEIKTINERFQGDIEALDSDPTGPVFQSMLASDSHRERIAHFRTLLERERKRLMARQTLANLCKDWRRRELTQAPTFNALSAPTLVHRRLERTAATEPTLAAELIARGSAAGSRSGGAGELLTLRRHLFTPRELYDAVRAALDGVSPDGVSPHTRDAAALWERAWSRRVSCWFGMQPTALQARLGACAGALGLHLSSRLDAAWRASQSALGRTAPQPQTPAQPIAEGCEWISDGASLILPEVPNIPHPSIRPLTHPESTP